MRSRGAPTLTPCETVGDLSQVPEVVSGDRVGTVPAAGRCSPGRARGRHSPSWAPISSAFGSERCGRNPPANLAGKRRGPTNRARLGKPHGSDASRQAPAIPVRREAHGSKRVRKGSQHREQDMPQQWRRPARDDRTPRRMDNAPGLLRQCGRPSTRS